MDDLWINKAYIYAVRIMVTGANGFLGSWICRVLSTEHEVTAIIRPHANDYRLFGIDFLKTVRGQEDEFHNIVKAYSPEVVILCDWWGVESDFRNDQEQFSNVKRFGKRISSLNSVSTVIGIGSQAEIGPKFESIPEEVLDAPTTLYGKAKVEVRELLQSKLNPDVRFVWGRTFSSYGPLDSESWFLPSTINKILKRQRVPLTKGEQEWSFLHALDLGLAIGSIVSNENIKGVVNLGNPNTNTISEVAHFIGDFLGASDLLDFGVVPYREDQVMRLSPEITKLKEIAWQPQVEIWSGILSLIEWMTGKEHISINLLNGQTFNFRLPIYASKK
jgi:nucleoside-diphosphate-sugar epimerase